MCLRVAFFRWWVLNLESLCKYFIIKVSWTGNVSGPKHFRHGNSIWSRWFPPDPFWQINSSVTLLFQQAVHPKINTCHFSHAHYLNTALNQSLITVTAKTLWTVLSTALHKYLSTPLMSLSFSLITVCRKMEAIIIVCPHYACPSKKRIEGTMMDKGLSRRQDSLSHINPGTSSPFVMIVWLL